MRGQIHVLNMDLVNKPFTMKQVEHSDDPWRTTTEIHAKVTYLWPVDYMDL